MSATSVAAFMVILGFLAGRMNGGADPGLASDATDSRSALRQKAPADTAPTATRSRSATQSHPTTQAPTSSAPAAGGGYTSVAPDPSPPTTHSS